MISNAVTKSVYEAEDNRLKCSYCKDKIKKGQHYYREAKQGWRNSHTINMCRDCAMVLSVKFGFDDKEMIQVKKELILIGLEENDE